MSNKKINIEKAIVIVNSKSTTVDQLCKFIYNDIQDYQNEREAFHMEEFKSYAERTDENLSNLADEYTQIILNKIQNDTKKFSVKYAIESIDDVLDAMNQKKFKTKQGPINLLVLLSTLKEMNEETI